MRVAISTLLTTVLLSSPFAGAAEIPQEWFVCEASADCTVVSSSCGPSTAVNIHHKDEAQAEICKTENCSGSCDGSARQAYAAICKNGECVPDYTAPPPPPPHIHYQINNFEIRCPPDNPNCGLCADKKTIDKKCIVETPTPQ